MAKERIPYFFWREGRPRWIPGPKVRAEGFKGTDLKDETGAWLDYGKAVNAARELNANVERKREGKPPAIPVALVGSARTVNLMVDEFLNRPKMRMDEPRQRGNRYTRPTMAAPAELGRQKKKLALKSRRAYHAHGQMLKDWMGDAPAASLTPAMMEGFYDDRINDRGLSTANAIMRSWKAMFNFAEVSLRWNRYGLQNPVRGLEMDSPDGRLVLWPRPAIDCYIAVADYLGCFSLGDAVIEALLTSQRLNDVLSLKDATTADGIYRFRQRKTGREAKVKAVPMLLDRVTAMHERKRARWSGNNTVMEYEIISEVTGQPYPVDGSSFSRRFRALKLIAAGGNGNNADMDAAMTLLGVTDAQLATMPIARVPLLNDLWFRDLRDTAVTWLAAAGCDRFEIATVTGLSLKSVDAIMDKHYWVREDGFAISAGDKLAAHMDKTA